MGLLQELSSKPLPDSRSFQVQSHFKKNHTEARRDTFALLHLLQFRNQLAQGKAERRGGSRVLSPYLVSSKVYRAPRISAWPRPTIPEAGSDLPILGACPSTFRDTSGTGSRLILSVPSPLLIAWISRTGAEGGFYRAHPVYPQVSRQSQQLRVSFLSTKS